jgi:hypothetical protein
VKRLGIVSLLLLGGCSTSFHRDWESVPKAAGGLEGAWDGTWLSDDSGHTGSLRCIITRREDRGFDARYYATYGWFLFWFDFEYTIPTTAVAEGAAWLLRGSAVLDSWIAGGLYEYEARVEQDEYVASYRSSFDRGIFRMKRVR